ncbi:glycosyltransferase family 2 protein [candidate division CSSED10-310 bacterium]|uniref:Glycosyltransferase family 2 protein n=1 Tax=candidate division CSSED10-310 bacterium TaxID=2855610 RepID=A0ABV6YRH5_UNCC1
MGQNKSSLCSISVIVPTRDRGPLLKSCLEALVDQSLDSTRYEVIVIDDGSFDQTRETVTALKKSTPVSITYRFQKASGPAAARNRGIKQARGRIILITGDDYIADHDLLTQHLQWHEELYPEDNSAVLGYARRHPDFEDDEITQWTEEEGLQFYYSQIKHGDEVSFFHFITCNISMKKKFFEAHGPFDEDFRYAMGEDAELAFRLFRAGLRLYYNQEALAYHHHPANRDFIKKRLRLFGEMQVLQDEKCPGIIDIRGYDIDPFKRLIHALFLFIYPFMTHFHLVPARFRKKLNYLEYGIWGHRSIRAGCRSGLQKLYPDSTRSQRPSVLLFTGSDINCFYRHISGIRGKYPDFNLILVGPHKTTHRIMARHPEIDGFVVCPHPEKPLWYSSQKNFRDQIGVHHPQKVILLGDFGTRFRADHYLTALFLVGAREIYGAAQTGSIRPLKLIDLFNNSLQQHVWTRELIFEIWHNFYAILYHFLRLINLVFGEPLRLVVKTVRSLFSRGSTC